MIELFAFNDLNLVILEKANCVKLMADILQKCEKADSSPESKLLVHQTLKCISVILRNNQITLKMLEMKLAPLFTKLLKDYSKDPVVMKLVLRILRMTLVNKKSYEILET